MKICLKREIDMQMDRWRSILQRAGLHGAFCSSIVVVVVPAAYAGPCTTQISSLERQIKLSASNPEVGPTGQQTIGAQLHHQPTPGTVERAETKANADADAALDRARKADAAGDASGCQSALIQARRLYGLEK